ncbi:hypothetical protein ACFPYI_16800 [Halomarina salina]|uniref:Uncharacterized protein n=1 Tax=Halomarina salina TaxID=1872699 RepID=A0ABD5RQX7_9EURY|nr:hypothetical protein [Halomarina salina]
MALGRRALYAMLLGAGIFVALGGYTLASGGEELLAGALYIVAGGTMVYSGVALYRARDE